jgi:hypothetical protein
MTIDNLHATLARNLLGEHPTEDDGLALMLLLHTSRILLREAISGDRPGIMEVAAITQRQAATVVATVWPNRTDKERVDYRYWYFQFNVRTPYEVLEDLPAEWLARVARLRDALSQHPMVKEIRSED